MEGVSITFWIGLGMIIGLVVGCAVTLVIAGARDEAERRRTVMLACHDFKKIVQDALEGMEIKRQVIDEPIEDSDPTQELHDDPADYWKPRTWRPDNHGDTESTSPPSDD